jgi:hypothetical protein
MVDKLPAYFTALDFKDYKLVLGLEDTILYKKATWVRQPDNVLVRSLLPEDSPVNYPRSRTWGIL